MLQRVDHARYDRQTPLDLSAFLHGALEIDGRFSLLSGLVTQEFIGTATGMWCDGTLVLDESFSYDNGRSEQRTWRLTFAPGGTFTSTCADVVGAGAGLATEHGYTHTYLFRLPIGRNGLVARIVETYEPISKERVHHTANLCKWGVPFGTITMLFVRR